MNIIEALDKEQLRSDIPEFRAVSAKCSPSAVFPTALA